MTNQPTRSGKGDAASKNQNQFHDQPREAKVMAKPERSTSTSGKPNERKESAKRYAHIAHKLAPSALVVRVERATKWVLKNTLFNFGFWTAAGTVAIAITSYYQWQAITGQLTELKRTNAIAERQQRPWISLETPPEMNGPALTLHVKNYGTAVARMVVGRAYLLSSKRAPTWKQAESQEEFDSRKLRLNICEDAVLASTNYDPPHVSRLVVFPTQMIPIPEVPLKNLTGGEQARYVAVCVAYQGIRPAEEITAERIGKMTVEQWLHEQNLFHVQSLYEIRPNSQLTIADADAYDTGQ